MGFELSTGFRSDSRSLIARLGYRRPEDHAGITSPAGEMYVQQWPFLVCRRFLWRISRHNSLMILFEACSSTVFFSFYANTSVNLRILPDGQPQSAWLWSRRLAMVRPASPCPRRKLSPY